MLTFNSNTYDKSFEDTQDILCGTVSQRSDMSTNSATSKRPNPNVGLTAKGQLLYNLSYLNIFST